MRIVLLGALGEVGTALAGAMRSRGHDVVRVTSRREAAGAGAAWLGALPSLDAPDAVVNAAGPGDHRAGRDWREAAGNAERAVAGWEAPKVLLSTIRVMEGAVGDFDEDAAAIPTTPYGMANAEHERRWLEHAGAGARVLRVANIVTVPSGPGSPQERLLPWSLATEALATGTIGVRSGSGLVKGFVDPDGIVRAIESLVDPAAPPVAATAPAAGLSLGQLVEAVQGAFADVGLPRPRATFGPDGPQGPRCRPGWLRSAGWSPGLDGARVRALVAGWLAQRARSDS